MFSKYFRTFSTSFIAISFALGLASCAHYRASSLAQLNPTQAYCQEKNGVVVQCKAFDKADCKRYLDRDVIKKGYQPIQIIVQNNSSKTWILSPEGINLPCARANEVADKVHTSTGGRAVGYGAGSLILWPLIIPAVVDGLGSAEANSSLDLDFSSKSLRQQVIYPNTHVNTLVFIPVESFTESFILTLVEQNTQEKEVFSLNASQ